MLAEDKTYRESCRR